MDFSTLRAIFEQPPGQKKSDEDRSKVLQAVFGLTFFKKFSMEGKIDEIHSIIDNATLTNSPIDTCLLEIDVKSNWFYIILKGQVGLYIPRPKKGEDGEEEFDGGRLLLMQSNQIDNQQASGSSSNNKRVLSKEAKQRDSLHLVKVLKSGESFGEVSLLYDRGSDASIYCLEDTWYLQVPKEIFLRVIGEEQRESIAKEVAFLSNHPLFENWSFNLLRLLYIFSEKLQFSKNESVFKEGDKPTHFYIIRNGEFAIHKQIDSRSAYSSSSSSNSYNQNRRNSSASNSTHEQSQKNEQESRAGEYFSRDGGEAVNEYEQHAGNEDENEEWIQNPIDEIQLTNRRNLITGMNKRKNSLQINHSKPKRYQIAVIGKGEVFGEEDILSKQPRSYSITCSQSQNGNASIIAIKRQVFKLSIMSDIHSSIYINKLLKQKHSNMHSRLSSLNGFLKSYSGFLNPNISLEPELISNPPITKSNSSNKSQSHQNSPRSLQQHNQQANSQPPQKQPFSPQVAPISNQKPSFFSRQNSNSISNSNSTSQQQSKHHFINVSLLDPKDKRSASFDNQQQQQQPTVNSSITSSNTISQTGNSTSSYNSNYNPPIQPSKYSLNASSKPPVAPIKPQTQSSSSLQQQKQVSLLLNPLSQQESIQTTHSSRPLTASASTQLQSTNKQKHRISFSDLRSNTNPTTPTTTTLASNQHDYDEDNPYFNFQTKHSQHASNTSTTTSHPYFQNSTNKRILSATLSTTSPSAEQTNSTHHKKAPSIATSTAAAPQPTFAFFDIISDTQPSLQSANQSNSNSISQPFLPSQQNYQNNYHYHPPRATLIRPQTSKPSMSTTTFGNNTSNTLNQSSSNQQLITANAPQTTTSTATAQPSVRKSIFTEQFEKTFSRQLKQIAFKAKSKTRDAKQIQLSIAKHMQDSSIKEYLLNSDQICVPLNQSNMSSRMRKMHQNSLNASSSAAAIAASTAINTQNSTNTLVSYSNGQNQLNKSTSQMTKIKNSLKDLFDAPIEQLIHQGKQIQETEQSEHSARDSDRMRKFEQHQLNISQPSNKLFPNKTNRLNLNMSSNIKNTLVSQPTSVEETNGQRTMNRNSVGGIVRGFGTRPTKNEERSLSTELESMLQYQQQNQIQQQITTSVTINQSASTNSFRSKKFLAHRKHV